MGSLAPRALRSAVLLLSFAAILATPRAARADDFSDFFDRYWDPDAGEFYKYADHQNGHADYWWQAHMFETVIDHYRQTGRPDDEARIATVLDGFERSHPDWNSDGIPFNRNRYNDDLGWWALACLHAYEATGDKSYLHTAKDIYAKMTPPGDDGSVPWTQPIDSWRFWERSAQQPSDQDRNVATNTLYGTISAKLYQEDTDASDRQTYLDRALAVYGFLEKNLVRRSGNPNDPSGPTDPSGLWLVDTIHQDGTLDTHQQSYDYGGLVGLLLALRDATGQQSYRDEANEVAHAAVARANEPDPKKGGLEHDTSMGDQDGAGFDAILYRDLALLARSYGQDWVRPFLADRAAKATPTWGVFGSQNALETKIAAALAATPAPPPPSAIPPAPPKDDDGIMGIILREAKSLPLLPIAAPLPDVPLLPALPLPDPVKNVVKDVADHLPAPVKGILGAIPGFDD